MPFVTRWITSAADGFAASSDGPTLPVDPAAESTWQPPQPALAKDVRAGLRVARD